LDPDGNVKNTSVKRKPKIENGKEISKINSDLSNDFTQIVKGSLEFGMNEDPPKVLDTLTEVKL
jgi:hypothetical protein